MDWKSFSAAFFAVFLAELGDKTQLTTLSLASGGAKGSVFAGAALALVATTALAVVGADAIGRVIPVVWLNRAAGLLMVALGAMTLWNARG